MKYREDVDYIVEEDSVTIAVAGSQGQGQVMRQTSKIIKVWFVEEGTSYYLCNTCHEFRHENVNSVRSHLNKHATEERIVKQKLAAFELLPKAIQDKLLTQVKLTPDPALTGKKRPGPVPTTKTRYGPQPILDILLARDITTKQLGEDLDLSVDSLRQNFRGVHAPPLPTAVKISEHLGVPINQLFNGAMTANMREDGDDA